MPEDATPWTETIAGYECTHVKVEANCKAGLCRIPAGCFVAGSPTDEYGHGVYTEILRPVILTHSFLIQETEVTQAAWLQLMPSNQSGPNLKDPTTPAGKYQDCIADDCPVAHVNWYEAAEYANRLSRKEGRQECYVLKNCHGELGIRPDAGEAFACDTDYALTTESVYECEGYRLPTVAEYEYATRAGTRSTYYSGDLPIEFASECSKVLPLLDAIAWYCANANNTSHPVRQKLANRWGVFDAIGNIDEWSHNRMVMPNPGPYPWVDPYSQTGNPSGYHETKGCVFAARPGLLRTAARFTLLDEVKGYGIGFRLVRSLKSDETW